MKIINWQKVMMFNQFYTWKAFQKLKDNEILFVISCLDSSIRKKQGWNFPTMNKFDTVELKNYKWLIEGVRTINNHVDSVHVFSGFWSERKYLLFILYAAILRIKTVVLVEPYSTEPVGYLSEGSYFINSVKVKMRPLLYKIVATTIIKMQKKEHFCILTTSTKAKQQMLKAGFNEEQIFPFGYFIPKDELSQKQKIGKRNELRLVFVGALITRKGVDLAVKAIEILVTNGKNVSLDIYGAGNQEKLAYPISGCVTYRGRFQYGEAQKIISNYDALLLPSRHDGWGVVVNEALLQGIPVIVSDQVGASVLIQNSAAGRIFESENVESLCEIIESIIEKPDLLEDMQSQAEKLSTQISPDLAAKYLNELFLQYFFKKGQVSKTAWCLDD